MFNIVLVNPEIPPNSGNIIRLSANCGMRLHFVKPMGFCLDDKQLKRAGLDYREHASLTIHDSLDDALQKINCPSPFAVTGKGTVRYDAPDYKTGDTFVFGRESTGLSGADLSRFADDKKICIPMQKNSRSYNLANAVAIVMMEAWRQNNFA